jgi:hypothetical protein
MIDRMQELKLEIDELNKIRSAQLVELKQEFQVAFSDSWLDILLNKKSEHIKNSDHPMLLAIRQITECIIDQTALGKSKNKWAILLQHGIENLMPEIISTLASFKNKKA